MKYPTVAICGRTNVGKSTLFNRITHTHSALVHNLPGMTRDKNYGLVTYKNKSKDIFKVIDIGGFTFGKDDAINAQVNCISKMALNEAHVILFMVDAKDGCNLYDIEIASHLRKQNKPMILVINKMDRVNLTVLDSSFFELGFEIIHKISASHGDGINHLLDDIHELLPFHRNEAELQIVDFEDELRFAIVGRPNVGKSSLANRLLGYERSLISNIAGTTRDTVDTVFFIKKQCYRMIDTAGIKRKTKTYEGAEKLSILKTKQAMARADVSLLVLNALDGITKQDTTIAGYAYEAGTAPIIVVNKWDLVDKTITQSNRFVDNIRYKLNFLENCPIIFVSALTGQRVSKIINLINKVASSHAMRISTGKLNQFLHNSIRYMPPPITDGKQVKLYFMTQVGTRPPSFIIKTNTNKELHFSYKRFLENKLRETFDLTGTPIRFAFTHHTNNTQTAKVRCILNPGISLKPCKSAKSKY